MINIYIPFFVIVFLLFSCALEMNGSPQNFQAEEQKLNELLSNSKKRYVNMNNRSGNSNIGYNNKGISSLKNIPVPNKFTPPNTVVHNKSSVPTCVFPSANYSMTNQMNSNFLSQNSYPNNYSNGYPTNNPSNNYPNNNYSNNNLCHVNNVKNPISVTIPSPPNGNVNRNMANVNSASTSNNMCNNNALLNKNYNFPGGSFSGYTMSNSTNTKIPSSNYNNIPNMSNYNTISNFPQNSANFVNSVNMNNGNCNKMDNLIEDALNVEARNNSYLMNRGVMNTGGEDMFMASSLHTDNNSLQFPLMNNQNSPNNQNNQINQNNQNSTIFAGMNNIMTNGNNSLGGNVPPPPAESNSMGSANYRQHTFFSKNSNCQDVTKSGTYTNVNMTTKNQSNFNHSNNSNNVGSMSKIVSGTGGNVISRKNGQDGKNSAEFYEKPEINGNSSCDIGNHNKDMKHFSADMNKKNQNNNNNNNNSHNNHNSNNIHMNMNSYNEIHGSNTNNHVGCDEANVKSSQQQLQQQLQQQKQHQQQQSLSLKKRERGEKNEKNENNETDISCNINVDGRERLQNDYNQNFINTGERPQNFIRDSDENKRFIKYPKLKQLVELKNVIIKKRSTPARYISCDLRTFDLGSLDTKFDVILIDPPWKEYFDRKMHKFTLLDGLHMNANDFNYNVNNESGNDVDNYWSVEEIANLEIEKIAEVPSFLFLWCGVTHLEDARYLLNRWGYRRCEDICWLKTNIHEKNKKVKYLNELNNENSYLQRTTEHCLVGIKGAVRRSYDIHLIHANLDTDVIIAEETDENVYNNNKPEELYKIIEKFCLGRRKIELFGTNKNIRNGWLTLGKNIDTTLFNKEEYLSWFEGDIAWPEAKSYIGGKYMGTTNEIENLRPKSPPRNAHT